MSQRPAAEPHAGLRTRLDALADRGAQFLSDTADRAALSRATRRIRSRDQNRFTADMGLNTAVRSPAADSTRSRAAETCDFPALVVAATTQ